MHLLAAYRLAAWVAHRLPYPAGKLAAGVAGRRDAARRWIRWAAEQRGAGTLVWIHGASVGELLTARPVADRLRSAHPGLRLMYTHSSPSAAGWPVDPSAPLDYPPLDEPAPVRLVLAGLQPSLLAFARGDVWPELARQAGAAGVPLAVIGGTVRAGSLRVRWALRPVYRAVYSRLAWVGAVTREDAARWRRAGAPATAVAVTGDPRHDQAVERIPQRGALAPLTAWAAGRKVLVAGSTHAADERVLVAAAGEVLGVRDEAALLLVPHDPSDARVREVLDLCARADLGAAPWRPGTPAPGARCIVVAASGLLSDLYTVGALAYVGGGFRAGGVHAVVEPAARTLPVIVGPATGAVRDVRLLQAAGGAVALPAADPAGGLRAAWLGWLDHAAARRQAGLAARAALDQGAADRSARALGALLTGPPRSLHT